MLETRYHGSPQVTPRHQVMMRGAVLLLALATVAVVAGNAAQGTIRQDQLAAGVLGALGVVMLLSAAVGWFSADRLLSAMTIWLVSLTAALAAAAGYAPLLLGHLLGAEAIGRVVTDVGILHVMAHSRLLLGLFGRDLGALRASRLLAGMLPVGCLLTALTWLIPSSSLPAWGVAVCIAGVAVLVLALGQLLRLRRGEDVGTYAMALLCQAGTAGLQVYAATDAANLASQWQLLSFWSGSAIFLTFAGLAVADRIRAQRRRSDVQHREALEAARKYRHVYYSAPVALVSCTLAGHVLRWNELAQTFFGDELAHGRVNTLASVLGAERAAQLLSSLDASPHHKGELRVAGSAQVLAFDALLAGGAIEISFVDVSERSRLADAFEHMAHHDALTDVLNRRGLELRIDQALEGLRQGRAASLLYVDVDRFKAINDVFGHAAGDAVLIEVARRLTQALGDDGHVGRLGSDEYLVLLPGLGLTEARAVAARVMQTLTRDVYDVEGAQFDVDVSMGIVSAASGMHTHEWIAHAEEACRRSKQGGSHRITAMQPSSELLDSYRAAVRLGSELKSNLPIDRMRLFAQPIVRLTGDPSVLSYEVLLRSVDESGEIEPPARLLAAAERQGLMASIDRFVLQGTLEHLQAHREFADGLGFVAVNLSGMSLNDERFLRDAQAMLTEHRSIATRIMLEITESVALRDVSSTRRFVDRMRAIGVGIALDDFGAGYTSFAYLRDLPASLLKIDGQFIKGLRDDPKQRGIIQAIRQLGHQMGMACLAEWVEDAETLRALVELEVDYAQGYVFAKAQPIAHWLTTAVDLGPLLQSAHVSPDLIA